MSDFLAALGLVFVIEGLISLAFPTTLRRAMSQVAATPETQLRALGLVSAVVGLLIVWAVRWS